MNRLRFLLFTVVFLAAARPTGGSAQTAGLGSVSFPNSGAPGRRHRSSGDWP